MMYSARFRSPALFSSRALVLGLILFGQACAPASPPPAPAQDKPAAQQPAPKAADPQPAAKAAEPPPAAKAAAPQPAAQPPAQPAAAAPAPASVPSGPPVSLNFRNTYLPTMGYAQFWLAQKEYWPKLGLTVDVKPGQGGAQTVQIVGSGSEPVGYAEFTSFVTAVQQGVPITALMVISRRNASGLIFMEDSGIKTWKDLPGKTIGTNVASDAGAMLLAIAKREGINQEDLRIVTVDAGARESLLLQKKVDAFTAFARAQDVWMRCTGSPGATSWPFAEHGFDIYGQVVIANTNWLKTAPDDVVQRFLYGIIQASTAMKQNPENAFNVMREANPAAVLDRAKEVAGMAKEGGYVRWQWDAPSKPFQDNGFGWIDPTELSESQDRLVEAGILKEKIDVSRYYTPKYLEHPAIRQAALEFNKTAWGEVPADVKQQCGVS